MGSIFLSILSALLLILSFPKFDIGFLAWVAFTPLLIAMKNKNLVSAAGLSFLTGIVFFSGVFYWVSTVSGFRLFDFLLLGTIFSLYFCLFGIMFIFVSESKILPSTFTVPVLWVSVEYLRSNAGFLSFPWVLLGHSQYLNLPIIQISSLTGAYGVSFLIAMVNAALSEVMQNSFKTFKPVIVALSVLLISLVYGFIVLSQGPAADNIKVSVVQGNISQDVKWNPQFRKQNIEKHIQLTKEAFNNSNPALIVWPETAVTGFLKNDIRLLQAITDLARESNAYLVIGGSQYAKFGSWEFRKNNWFNSAFLLSPGGTIVGQYNKIRLLPFGEYLPYKNSFPWPSRFASLLAETGTNIPGNEHTIFNLDKIPFAVLICWENIFPDLFRMFVKKGARFMVNITNEAWFGETAAPYQFVSMSVFRAVENRISIVRSANTGISCFIDPHGKIFGKIKNNNKDIFVEGHLTKEISLSQQRTFYTQYGDIFAYSNLFITMVMLGWSFFKKRTVTRQSICIITGR